MAGRVARTFEELQIYQRARELTNRVYQACRVSAFSRDRSLVDQIRRACVSVMSNIAEGFERGSKTEFMQFLYIAKGSCGEVRAQLQIAADQRYITSQEHGELTELCRNISKMISSFIAHLQGSGYQGEKFARPQRLSDQAAEKRHNTLRAAQLLNMSRADNADRSFPNAS
jgi:four helix bundle protein